MAPRGGKRGPRAWRNRIVGHDERPASEFLANPANWRIHPKHQQDALDGTLDEIGWIQQVIVNRRTSPEWGRDQNVETLIDGYLRMGGVALTASAWLIATWLALAVVGVLLVATGLAVDSARRRT